MTLSKSVQDRIGRLEEAVNFPPSLRAHQNYHWKNLPLVPFSDLRGAVTSLAERGRKVAILTGL